MTRTFTQDEIAVLIAKLEVANGLDRGLDEAIVRILCPSAVIQYYVQGDFEKTVFHAEPLVENKSYVPAYSASIDAALTLVPLGHTWAAGDLSEDDAPWACLTNAETYDFSAQAATVAIALCIAALRARASIRESGTQPSDDSQDGEQP